MLVDNGWKSTGPSGQYMATLTVISANLSAKWEPGRCSNLGNWQSGSQPLTIPTRAVSVTPRESVEPTFDVTPSRHIFRTGDTFGYHHSFRWGTLFQVSVSLHSILSQLLFPTQFVENNGVVFQRKAPSAVESIFSDKHFIGCGILRTVDLFLALSHTCF